MWHFKHSPDTAGTSETAPGRQCSVWTGGGLSEVRSSPTLSWQCHGTARPLLMSVQTTGVSTMQKMENRGLWSSSLCRSAPSFGALTPFCLAQGSVDSWLPVQTNHCSDLPRLILRLFVKPDCCFNLNWYFRDRPSVCVGQIKAEQFAQISRCLNSLGTSTQSLRILGLLNLTPYTQSKKCMPASTSLWSRRKQSSHLSSA